MAGNRPKIQGNNFSKISRLLKRRQFLDMADRKVAPDLKIRAGVFLVVGRGNGFCHNRLGVTVTKKIGPAVTRNLVKRIVREFFRLQNRAWPQGFDYLFIAGPEAGNRQRWELWADLAKVGQKISALPLTAAAPQGEAQSGGTQPEQSGERVLSSEGLSTSGVEVPVEVFDQTAGLGRAEMVWASLTAVPAQLALGFIFFYQKFISPSLPPACRFWPTCSSYAASAIKIHGFWRGSCLAAWRILKCHPFHPGGYDPVPPKMAAGCFQGRTGPMKRP